MVCGELWGKMARPSQGQLILETRTNLCCQEDAYSAETTEKEEKKNRKRGAALASTVTLKGQLARMSLCQRGGMRDPGESVTSHQDCFSLITQPSSSLSCAFYCIYLSFFSFFLSLFPNCIFYRSFRAGNLLMIQDLKNCFIN